MRQRPHESDMTREAAAAYRAVKRNIGAEYLERAARVCEERADGLERPLREGGWFLADDVAEARIVIQELRAVAERIRQMKEE